MGRIMASGVIAGACALVLGAAGASAEMRPAPGMAGWQRPFFGAAVAAAPEGRLARHPGTGLVTYLPADAAAPAVGAAPAATAEGAARAFVAANVAAFGLADVGTELRLDREAARPGGGSVVRYRQLVGGIPVFGGEVSVAVGADRRVRFAAAETIVTGPITLEPNVAAAAAIDEAVAATAAKYVLPASALVASEPELQVYDDVVFDPGRHTPGIVWRLEVTSALRPLRELVLVDARRGGVRLAFNQVGAAKSLGTYTMDGSGSSSLLPGALICTESDLGCAAGDADAKAAHAYASDTYDYFSGVLGRDGIDGAGMRTVSSVHFAMGFANAFWNGRQAVYEDGYPQADDLVGHELAHGVMQHAANLYSWAESGAISESISDLHGEFVDQRNGAGSDAPADLWYIGEDAPGFCPVRYMADPPAYDSPDRIGSHYYYTGLDDNAGVHTNSGVNNKAAYLMAAGGTFNGQTVAAPLGNDKVAWLYYTVQSGCLTEAANYNDLANCLRTTCDALAAEPVAGKPVLTTEDCVEVRKAIAAVEMDSRPEQRFVDDSSTAMTYTGRGWFGVQDSTRGTLFDTWHRSTKVGDTATVRFSGSRLAVHTTLYSTAFGALDLFLDSTDRKIGSIDQATSDGGSLYLTGLPSGTHKLIMRHAKSGMVTVDAVSMASKAVSAPAFGAADYKDGWAYLPFETQYLAYQGTWLVRPGSLSYSSKVGGTARFSFTGNAFTIRFSVARDRSLGRMQIYLDGELIETISQQSPRFAPGLWDYARIGLSFKKHTVKVRHSSGGIISLAGYGAFNLGLR